MNVKLTALASALFLLAACETAPGTDGSGTGTGAGMESTAPGTPGDFVNNVGDRVFFDYNASTLSSEAQATLEKQAQWLKTYGDYKITVEGHCDERGTREYNLALGERRANAAKSFLVNSGIDASRVTTISYGKERPAMVGSDESSWAQNRRAVTVVAK